MPVGMKSIQRGLWDGEVEKDARGRFACRVCGQSLTVREESSGGATVRTCPDCDREWEAR
jgi:ribosomal protein L37AE/L43A